MFKAVGNAHNQIVDLESQANEMFDHLVHSGFSHDDMEFVELAQAEAKKLIDLTEAAIANLNLQIEHLQKDKKAMKFENQTLEKNIEGISYQIMNGLIRHYLDF